MMFARDPESQRAANTLLGEEKAILSPDFTIALSSVSAHGIDLPERYLAFVPNFRMLKRREDPGGASYTALVQELLCVAQARGLGIVIVLHSRDEDVPLATRIAEVVPGARTVTDADPRVLKTVLGGAEAVIGSRFHALVSAMSQGVPCIGLGWAHKYAWLFSDFSAGDYLIDVADADAARSRLAGLLDS